MAGIAPGMGGFLWWWGLHEPAGENKVDFIHGYELEDVGTTAQYTGHSSVGAVDLTGASNGLRVNDASWNTFGNESITFGIWWNISTYGAGPAENVLFGKFDKDNDKEYGAWFNQTRPLIGINHDGGHVWADAPYGASGALATNTWYLTLYEYNASADIISFKIYNTSGSTVAADGTGTADEPNADGFGASTAVGHLTLGANDAITQTSWQLVGRLDEFFAYSGVFSADEEAWIVNGGDGRQYSDLLAGGWQVWFSEKYDWLKKDGAIKSGRLIEELWKQNQRLKGLPEALPI